MNKKIFIIGKRSNLSQELRRFANSAELISGDELWRLPDLLVQAGRSDIVYNLYYKSVFLGRRDTPEAYARYAFQRLAEFSAICQKVNQHIAKVVFTSSSAVYGNNIKAAETDRCNITNLYASLKLASEMFLSEHLADTNIPLVIARVFNMYGADDEFSVVSKIADALSRGFDITVANHGQSVRDFVHIRDVVEIYLRLLESPFRGVVNVGSGTGLSVSDLILKAETSYGRRLRAIHVERNEIDHSVACIDTLLGAVGPIEFFSVDQYYQEQCVANG